MGRTPIKYTPTEPVVVESKDARRARLAAELAEHRPSRGGRLWGLPELDDPDDEWVDITGAEAITGLSESAIRNRLNRSDKFAVPFPAPHTFFSISMWPRSSIARWDIERCQAEGRR